MNRTTGYTVEVRRPAGSDAGVCSEGVLIARIYGNRETGKSPIRIQPAVRRPPVANVQCGALSEAPFTPVAGRNVFEQGRVRIEVIGRVDTGYRVTATLR